MRLGSLKENLPILFRAKVSIDKSYSRPRACIVKSLLNINIQPKATEQLRKVFKMKKKNRDQLNN